MTYLFKPVPQFHNHHGRWRCKPLCMKRYLLSLFLIVISRLYAQVPEDAIRYSWFPHNGSARYMATGGVMGSLGGDITAQYVNPAGLGFFKTGEVVFTPGYLLKNNKAMYRGNQTVNDKNALSIGTIGWVQGYGKRYQPKKTYALSIGLNQLANFNNYYSYSALNNYSSFSEQLAEEFSNSGLSISDALNTQSALPYTAAPGLYTYLIDTMTMNGARMVRGAPEGILDAGQAIRQEMTRRTRGGMYELSLAYAENDNDKWYWGGTIGIPFVTYRSETTFSESDTSSNKFNGFESFQYRDNFKTQGIGLNLRVGAIYRPQEYFRIGLALHSPSFFMMTDTRDTYLSTVLESDSGTIERYQVSSNEFTNGQPGESRYYQSSAWKAIISASYVFREVENVKRQRAFISADIEYVNHRGSRFSSNNESPTDEEKAYFKGLNRVVKDEFKGTFNFRVGGELKFNTIMGRLGFAYYGNPYKDRDLKANRMLLSGGLGYRNHGFFIDLTYVHQISKDINFPYRLSDRANTLANLKQVQGQLVATLGIKI